MTSIWHFKACSCLSVYKLKQQQATLSISYELSKGSTYEFLQISMCFLSLKLEAPKKSTSVLSTLRIRVHPPKCVHLPCHSEKALRPLQVGQWFLGFSVQMTSAQPAYSHIGLLWNDFGMYQENIKPAMSKVVFREWAPMNSWKQTLQSMPYAFSSATARKRVLQTGCSCFFRAWNLQPTSENVSGG